MIAAVKKPESLTDALQSPCEVLFLLYGSLFNLSDIIEQAKERQKCIYLHVDLLEGFARDEAAVRYIGEKIKPDGIITTRSNLVKLAHDIHLPVVQRFFIVDSLSVHSAVKSVGTVRPAAVEIMPGIMPNVISGLCRQMHIPLIAGGLISTKEDVIAALGAGAMGVSTTRAELWNL